MPGLRPTAPVFYTIVGMCKSYPTKACYRQQEPAGQSGVPVVHLDALLY